MWRGRACSSMCSTHTSRKQRHGGTEAYAKRPGPAKNIRREAWVTSGGYIATSFYGVQCYVHRLVWMLGNGPIPEGYHVHHIDGDKTNNSPGNLCLLSASEHHKLHAKSKWSG